MPDHNVSITAIGSNLPGLYAALLSITAFIGVILVIVSVVKLIAVGRAGQEQKGIHIAGVIVGGGMFSLQQILFVGGVTLFNATQRPVILTAFEVPADYTTSARAFYLVVSLISFLGWFLAARGLYTFYDGGKYKDRGFIRKGVTFLVVASCCAYFAIFVDVIATSVGASQIGHQYFSF